MMFGNIIYMMVYVYRMCAVAMMVRAFWKRGRGRVEDEDHVKNTYKENI